MWTLHTLLAQPGRVSGASSHQIRQERHQSGESHEYCNADAIGPHKVRHTPEHIGHGYIFGHGGDDERVDANRRCDGSQGRDNGDEHAEPEWIIAHGRDDREEDRDGHEEQR